MLCQNCDWETHNNFRCVHDRRPIEGFNGSPSVSELLNFLGLEDLGKKSLVFGGGNDDGLLDFLVWETPAIVSLDDLIVSNDSVDSGRSFQAMGVPPLPKVCSLFLGKICFLKFVLLCLFVFQYHEMLGVVFWGSSYSFGLFGEKLGVVALVKRTISVGYRQPFHCIIV